MRILVLGDTHGRISIVTKVLQQQRFDYMLFTGDFIADAVKISAKLGVKYKGVRGNCDPKTGEEEQIIELDGKRFYIIHGHQYAVKKGYSLLSRRGREVNADAVVCGHTHVSYCKQIDGMWLINPGSPSFPRRSASSYAIVETNGGAIYPNIIEF
ncbi:MAG: metallophosphoesterase [Syntrophomonadaceae bacterium]|jgi:putative phosphoesterase|nr:metallophosphoesterase [Syntrophomonadaceae bacterium]